MHLSALQEHLQNADGATELYGAGELAGALERLSSGGVDAVILDPDLPDSQGIVSFERMYAFAPDVPVIAISAHEAYLRSMEKLGAARILAKPFHISVLIEAVDSVRPLRA